MMRLSPRPVFGCRLMIETPPVRVWSGVVRAGRKMAALLNLNKTRLLQNYGLGGPGGPGNFPPITHVRACVCVISNCILFLYRNTRTTWTKPLVSGLSTRTRPRTDPGPPGPPGPNLKGGISMNTGLANLEEKYGDLDFVLPDPVVPDAECLEENREVPERWQESETVCQLSAFIKVVQDQGFAIKQTMDGYPIMTFDHTVLEIEESERLVLEGQALLLFKTARDDLQKLIRSKDIFLPVYPWLTKEDLI